MHKRGSSDEQRLLITVQKSCHAAQSVRWIWDYAGFVIKMRVSKTSNQDQHQRSFSFHIQVHVQFTADPKLTCFALVIHFRAFLHRKSSNVESQNIK